MKLSKKELMLLGASLYICEGTKERINCRGGKNYAVEFTNKDPQVIKIFMRFLREVIKAEEDRIKTELFIYPDLNEKKLINFWAKTTNIPHYRFNKTITLIQKNKKYKPNPLGTLKIRYTHKEHFLKIQDIISKIFNID